MSVSLWSSVYKIAEDSLAKRFTLSSNFPWSTKVQFHFVNQALTQITRLPKKSSRKHFIEEEKNEYSLRVYVHSTTTNISIRRYMISTKTQKMTNLNGEILNGTAASSGRQFGLKMKSKHQFIKSYSPQRAMILAMCGEGENPPGVF